MFFVSFLLKLMLFWGRGFPASFPLGYAHKRLAYASSPFLFHAVHSVCYSESQISESMVQRI